MVHGYLIEADEFKYTVALITDESVIYVVRRLVQDVEWEALFIVDAEKNIKEAQTSFKLRSDAVQLIETLVTKYKEELSWTRTRLTQSDCVNTSTTRLDGQEHNPTTESSLATTIATPET